MKKWIVLCWVLLGCNEPSSSDDACAWVADQMGCPECADGDVTCSFEDQSVTEMSCGGCQAQVGLMSALCDSGSTATAQDILDGMVCEDASPE